MATKTTKKSNVKNTNSKTAKGRKANKVLVRKRVPKGDAGAASSEAQELKTNGKARSRKPVDDTEKKARSRKPTDDTKKKTRTKSDSDKPLFNIFEVTLPDKTKVQRRFSVGKEIKGTLMVKLAADNKWYVLLWASKGDKLEKRAEIIANRHINKDNPRFKSLLYTEIRVGRDNIRIVEKNTRGKVELVEDRSTFNQVRKPEKVEGSEKPTTKIDKSETSSTNEAKKTSSKKKASPKKKVSSKKPIA